MHHESPYALDLKLLAQHFAIRKFYEAATFARERANYYDCVVRNWNNKGATRAGVAEFDEDGE